MANRARPRSAPEPAGRADRARMFGSRQHRGRREKINRATPAASASRMRRRVFTYLRWILPRGRPTFGSSRTPTPTGFLRDAPCAEPWAYLVGAGFQPLAAAASDEISPRSGHLSGRVAAPTRVGEAGGSRNLTGAPPPQKRFSLGLHPVSLGKTKEMGWNRQHNLKSSRTKRRVPPTPVKTHHLKGARIAGTFHSGMSSSSSQVSCSPSFLVKILALSSGYLFWWNLKTTSSEPGRRPITSIFPLGWLMA